VSLVIKETTLPGVVIIEPVIYPDQRGFFKELYHKEIYNEAGLDKEFVQDNHSHSVKGVLRGLHYQLKNPQDKLVTVFSGEIFDVVVDIRSGSPDFGKWTSIYLSSENKHQIYIPGGFAHGFCVLSDSADVVYKCTDFYSPDDEYGLLWSDEDMNIDWPVSEPIVSEKDKKYLRLKEIPAEHLPTY